MTSATTVLDARYRLGPLIARGGMSDVYRAVDERTGADVAVKVVRPGDPALANRMAREARALESLDHPNLVRLLDSGLIDAQAYLVMTYVDGSTLGARLRSGPLEPAVAARLGAAVADALTYIHAHGIVHRDVKPANVLITNGGQVRLGDFGVARLADASALTLAGTTLGTVAYMAPEQLENHQVGPTADVWSLGIVLLECLTGRRVYTGSPSEVIARRLTDPVPVPDAVPAPWRALLGRMLDRSPAPRPTARQVAERLRTPAFSAPGTPGGNLCATRPEKPPVWVRLRKRTAGRTSAAQVSLGAILDGRAGGGASRSPDCWLYWRPRSWAPGRRAADPAPPSTRHLPHRPRAARRPQPHPRPRRRRSCRPYQAT
jgi:serine/threonine protein kinase